MVLGHRQVAHRAAAQAIHHMLNFSTHSSATGQGFKFSDMPMTERSLTVPNASAQHSAELSEPPASLDQ
jgi:hypothetical protein